MADTNKIMAEIAREQLGIDTLETRNSDQLDFHEVGVWQVREALMKAYRAGTAAALDLAR